MTNVERVRARQELAERLRRQTELVRKRYEQGSALVLPSPFVGLDLDAVRFDGEAV